jgi:type II secretory pathway pseudopilin PulG
MTRYNCKLGHTLIEMVAVLILMSGLITIVSTLMRRSVDGYSRTMDRVFAEQASQRWTERLRNEIHQAAKADVSQDQESLTLKFANQESIHYVKSGSTTARYRTLGERRLPLEKSAWATLAKFRISKAENGNVITASLVPGFQIQARLGVDQAVASHGVEEGE